MDWGERIFYLGCILIYNGILPFLALSLFLLVTVSGKILLQPASGTRWKHEL